MNSYHRTRVLHSIMLIFVVFACAFLLTVPTTIAQTESGTQPDKMDRITLADGHVFVGDILSETDQTITMRVSIAGISALKTFVKKEVAGVEKDILDRPDKDKASAARSETKMPAGFPDPNDPRPVVYKIPIKGLIGWDVTRPVVEKLWKEALDAHAKYVIFEFDCHKGESDLTEIRDMFQEIKAEAKEHEIKLVAWVKEARGTSVAFVLLFHEIIFAPDGWMGDGQELDTLLKLNFSDEDVRAKMISAWVGICKGMAISGGHDGALCDAMIRPELKLWVKMEGDQPTFMTFLSKKYEDDSPTEIDSSEEEAFKLTVKDANHYGVATHSPARDLRTLMARLDDGIREYNYYEGSSEKTIDNFMALRDRSWDDVGDLMQDISLIDQMPIDQRNQIGRKIQKWKKIIHILKACPPNYKAPYGRTQDDKYGIMPLENAEFQLKQLQQQLRELNQSEQTGRSGGSGSSGRGKGGGGGG